MKKMILSACILPFLFNPVFAQKEYAISLATTIMQTYPDSMVVMKYAGQLEQDNLIRPGQTAADAQKNRPANWNYEMGVVLMGFERLWQLTGDNKYMEYTKRIIDHFITEDGKIRTYVMEEYNIDNVPTGRQLLKLYELYKDEKYNKAAAILRQQISCQPRNKAGGFWHKLKYPTQMWLDGLYMAEPFYISCAVKNNTPGDFDDIINQFVWMEKYSRDAKTGLLYHGWDESRVQKWANPSTGRSPEFWSRAMGWYLMALVDVLDYLPKDHARRKELIAITNRLATALVKYQDKDSGVWWQITDKANKEGNYLESSASSMFVFGIAKAVRMGYLNKSFSAAAKKGFDGLLKQFVEKDTAGIYHFTKAVSGAGLGGTPYRDGSYQYYISEPQRRDDLKAIGPFIQACVEMELGKK